MNAESTLIFLTPGFAANENDSTCLPMQQSLIRTINEIYPAVKIIILSFQYPYYERRYEWFNTTVYSFNGRNKGGISKLLLRRKILNRLQEINRSKKIIGLISFWYGECAYIGKKFGEKLGIKHCCWILGQDARKGNKYPGRVFHVPTELIALSDFIQKEFQKNYGIKPAYIIPPGINPKHYPPMSDQKDIDILAAGSLIPLKQYDILIEIVSKIKPIIPHIKVVLIGSGPERIKLKNLVTKYSLEDNFCFAGELLHHEVLQFMQKAKVFLHPSSYEGFGVVNLEALYAGAHVISFVQPMNQEIKNWHVVQTKEEMIEKTTNILKRPSSLFDSQLAFSMNETANKMMQLFL